MKLSVRDDKGVSKREHLMQVEKQLGFTPDGLKNTHVFPWVLRNVWAAFCDLSASRGSGATGLNPISFGDIKAWSDITNTPISPREVSVIKELDKLYLRILG